jgi:hypothetical protein
MRSESKSRQRTWAAAVVAMAATAAATTQVRAASTWTGASTGDHTSWIDGTNWTPAGVPVGVTTGNGTLNILANKSDATVYTINYDSTLFAAGEGKCVGDKNDM